MAFRTVMTVVSRYIGAFLAMGLGLVAAAGGISAEEYGRDHDRARELYEHGEIHALREVLRTVGDNVDGDVVGIALVEVSGRWLYRVQVVSADGRRLVVDVDAGSNRYLGEEPATQ